MNNSQELVLPRVPSRTPRFFMINAVGICLYLFGASFGWVTPELADVPGAVGGGAIVWFLFAVPIFLIFLIGNGGVFLWSCWRRYKNGRWFMSIWGWLVPVFWALAVWLDFARHGS